MYLPVSADVYCIWWQQLPEAKLSILYATCVCSANRWFSSRYNLSIRLSVCPSTTILGCLVCVIFNTNCFHSFSFKLFVIIIVYIDMDIDIEILFCVEYCTTCNISPGGVLLRQTRINKHF